MGQTLTYLRRKSTKEISFDDLAAEIRAHKCIVALTGAGVSADSGIPTFRDPSDGLWTKYDPSTYATIWGFWRHPEKIWELVRDFLTEHDPQPNAGHEALAEMERMGFLHGIITQNVDNLHQDAGSKEVVEFHGNLMKARCYKCKHPMELNKDMLQNESLMKSLPPKCERCGGNMKPDAILFGEGIPSKALRDSKKLTRECDLMIVIGTSASVSPSSDLPYLAMNHGAKVIEVNMDSTGLTNRISDSIVLGSSSDLTKTVAILRKACD